MEILIIVAIIVIGIIGYLFTRNPYSVDLDSEPVKLIGSGNFDYEIVGESNYQKNIKKALGLSGGRSSKSFDVLIIPEDFNQYDDNALAVHVDWEKVGYLPKNEAKKFRKLMINLGLDNRIYSCSGTVWGGDPGKSYGIWLDFDPSKTRKHYQS